MAYNKHGQEISEAASATIEVTSAANLGSGGFTSYEIVTTTGVTVTVTGHGSTTTATNTNSPTFLVISGAEATTANFLQICINANSHLIATRDGAVVTITQAVPGAAGNTTITVTDPGSDGSTVQSFSGGSGPIPWGYSRAIEEKTGAPHDDRAGDFTMNHYKNITATYKHKSIPQVPFSRTMVPIRDPRVVATPLTSTDDVV